MNIAEYTLYDCATGHSYGPFELVNRARHCAEAGNIAEWEIIDRYGTLVAWQNESHRLVQPAERERQRSQSEPIFV